MRRTHILHRRDNRRFNREDSWRANPDDRIPVLAWLRQEDGSQQMELDGRVVAEVRPVRQTFEGGREDPYDPYVARILTTGEERTFDTADDARGYCERVFAKGG